MAGRCAKHFKISAWGWKTGDARVKQLGEVYTFLRTWRNSVEPGNFVSKELYNDIRRNVHAIKFLTDKWGGFGDGVHVYRITSDYCERTFSKLRVNNEGKSAMNMAEADRMLTSRICQQHHGGARGGNNTTGGGSGSRSGPSEDTPVTDSVCFYMTRGAQAKLTEERGWNEKDFETLEGLQKSLVDLGLG